MVGTFPKLVGSYGKKCYFIGRMIFKGEMVVRKVRCTYLGEIYFALSKIKKSPAQSSRCLLIRKILQYLLSVESSVLINSFREVTSRVINYCVTRRFCGNPENYYLF